MLESLLFEFLVFLQALLLDLSDFLYFALYSLLLFRLMRGIFNRLNSQLYFHFIGEKFVLAAPFTFADLFALEEDRKAFLALLLHVSLLLLSFHSDLLNVRRFFGLTCLNKRHQHF